MNPLMAFALADLARAEDAKLIRARTRADRHRDRPASEQAPAIRDGAWASAMARWAKAEDTAPCQGLGCATS